MQEDSNFVLPDSRDLDWAQIIYAVNYKRLMFINNSKTWRNFHTENDTQYIDYTPEELCHRFLERVLPTIYQYELAEDEMHLLNLLDLHPYFVRTDSGFNIVEQTENLTFPSNEAAIEALTKSAFNEINFSGENVETNHQILITGISVHHTQRNFNFSAENAALLSVVLSPDEDLPNCELLTNEELYKRLKDAKSRFENNGEQLENINIPINVLFKKLETLSKLKEAVIKLSKNFFTRNNF